MAAHQNKKIILIGAGGHAKVVSETAIDNGYAVSGYNDPVPSSYFTVPRLPDSECEKSFKEGAAFFMGIGGQTVEALKHRFQLFKKYADLSGSPKLVHTAASVSSSAGIHDGVLIAAGAIIQVGSEIGACSIVNSGAIVEHDSVIGKGVHIAPGAIVLGNAEIGDCSMIGSGAVVLPGVKLPANSFVKALSIQK